MSQILSDPSINDSDINLIQKYYWKRPTRKKWMIAIFFGSGALFSSRIILPINNYYLTQEFKWDQKTSGFILGSFFYGYMLTQLIGGYLGDRYGGEKVLTYAGFMWSLMTILFSQVSFIFSSRDAIIYGFATCRILLGVFQGFHFPSVCSLMAVKVAKTERQFTYSFMHSGSHCGTLFCGLFGAYLMEHFGWRVSFIFIGIIGLSWSTAVYIMLIRQECDPPESDTENISPSSSLSTSPELSLPNNRHVIIDLPLKLTTDDITDDTIIKSSIMKQFWFSLISNPAFWAMIFAHFTHNNCLFILISWLPSYFHDNYPHAKSWVFNVVPYIINIPSTLLSGIIADYMVKNAYSITTIRKLMTTIVLFGSGLCLMILSKIHNYYAALFWMAMALCFNGFHSSGILLNPQDLGPKHGGSIYGLMSMVGAIPGFTGVYFVGYILDTTKSWPMVFQCTGGFCFLGWVIYLIFGTGNQII